MIQNRQRGRDGSTSNRPLPPLGSCSKVWQPPLIRGRELMTRPMDLDAISEPTILEIWAPTCAECKAIQPDLEDVAHEFSELVDVRMINAADELETVKGLGVRATPTLIGVREGEEMFRIVGRRSRTELNELFEAVGRRGLVPKFGRQDLVVRVFAGLALLGAGLAGGPVWPLVILGTAVLIHGTAPLLWARSG